MVDEDVWTEWIRVCVWVCSSEDRGLKMNDRSRGRVGLITATKGGREEENERKKQISLSLSSFFLSCPSLSPCLSLSLSPYRKLHHGQKMDTNLNILSFSSVTGQVREQSQETRRDNNEFFALHQKCQIPLLVALKNDANYI